MSLKLDKRILLVLAILLMLVIIPSSFAADTTSDDADVLGVNEESVVDVSSAIDNVDIATSVDNSEISDNSNTIEDLNITDTKSSEKSSNVLEDAGDDYESTPSPSTVTYTKGTDQNIQVSVSYNDYYAWSILYSNNLAFINDDTTGKTITDISGNTVSGETKTFSFNLKQFSDDLKVGTNTIVFHPSESALSDDYLTDNLYNPLTVNVVASGDTNDNDTNDSSDDDDDTAIWVDASASSGGTGTKANPYNTISSAVSAASSGSTIKILAGNYSLYQLTIGKNLNIVGVGEVNITGSTSGAWLLTQSGTSVVNYTGLTFRDSYTGTNGIFYLRTTTNCYSNFIDCNFIENSGSCLLQVSHNVNMTRCNFINNYLSGSGSAGNSQQGILYNFYGSSKKLTINYCNFIGNSISGNIVHDYSNSPTVNLNNNYWGTNTKPTSGVYNINQNIISTYVTLTGSVEADELEEGDSTNVIVKFVNGATGADLTGSMATIDLELESDIGSVESFVTVKDNEGTTTYDATDAGEETITVSYGDTTLTSFTFTVEEASEGTIFVDATNGNDETGTGAKDAPYATIDKAIENIGDNYIITIREGNYTIGDEINIEQSITFNGKGNVNVNTGENSFWITNENDEEYEVNFNNIVFQNGESPAIGAMNMEESGSLTLTINDCVFKNFTCDQIIMISLITLNVENSVFYNNTVESIISGDDNIITANGNFWGTNEKPTASEIPDAELNNWVIIKLEMDDEIYQGGTYTVKAVATYNNGSELDTTLPSFDLSFANSDSTIGTISTTATLTDNVASASYTPTATGDDEITVSIAETELDSAEFTVLEKDTTKTYVDAERGDDTNGDGSSAKPYKTIQTAYSKDTLGVIAVNDGTYEFSQYLNLGKNIKIIATGDNVILKGTNTSNNIFSFSSSYNIELVGLTFTNSGGNWVVSGSTATSGNLKIINCTFINNTNTYGILRTYCLSEITGCTIINNTATGHSSGAFAGLIEFASGSQNSNFNYNIIYGNTLNNVNHVIIDGQSGIAINAEYNYWGSNDGIDSSLVSSGVTHPNWLVLNTELSDESAIVSGEMTITVKFEANDGSELDDTVSNKHITFSANYGTVSPANTAINNNEIAITYTGVSEGTESLVVYVDGVELTTVEFEVEEVPEGTIFVDQAKGSDETGNGEITNPYASIATAYANLGDNTQIIVKAGNYTVTALRISKNLTITGKGEVNIKAGSAYPPFLLAIGAETFTVNNLRFHDSVTSSGGFINNVSGNHNITINNCVFENITANGNALIQNPRGNIDIFNTIIANNTYKKLILIGTSGTVNNNYWGSNDKPDISDNFTLDNWVIIQTEMDGINADNELSAETYYDVNAKFMLTTDGTTYTDLTISMPTYTLSTSTNYGELEDIVLKDNEGSSKYISNVQDVEDEVIISVGQTVVNSYAFNITEREWGRIYVNQATGSDETGNGSKANPYASITQAILANNETGENEIIVYDGVYTGFYYIYKNVTITGRGDVVLDLNDSYFNGYLSGWSVVYPNIVLNNLTFINQGKQTMFQYVNDLTLNNCIVANGTGSSIIESRGKVVINNTLFSNLHYTSNTVPIGYNVTTGGLIIENSVFTDIIHRYSYFVSGNNAQIDGNYWGSNNVSGIVNSYYTTNLHNWVVAIPTFNEDPLIQGQTPTLTVKFLLTEDGENFTELTNSLPTTTLGLSSEINSFTPENVTIENNIGTVTYNANEVGDEVINLYDGDKIIYTFETFVEEKDSEDKIFVDASGDASVADGSKDKPYTTLEAALNALTDTRNLIVVIEGNYTISDYTISKDATIRWSKKDVNIKAENLVINADVTFENLILKDGNTITVNADKTLTVINTTFVENDGVIASNGNLIIKESKFIGNDADDNGIISVLGGTVDIKLSEFIANNNGEKPIVYAASGVTGDVNDNYWGANDAPNVSTTIAPTTWVALIIEKELDSINASETPTITFNFKNTTDGTTFSDLEANMPSLTVAITPTIGEIVPEEKVVIENNTGSVIYNATTEGDETITLSTEGVNFDTLEFHVGASVEGMIFVSKDGSDETGDGTRLKPYATIKNAISESEAGNIIVISEGTYAENYSSIYHNLEIIGVGEVIVTGNGSTLNNAMFTISNYGSYHVNFTNIKFTNITVSGSYNEYPSVIYGSTSSSYYTYITVTNCTFENNNANLGAITCNYGYVTINNSTFINNKGSSNTLKIMPIYVERGGLNITDSIIFDNSRYTFDVYLYSNINYVDINNNFWGNNSLPYVSNVAGQYPTNYIIVTAVMDSDAITSGESHSLIISFNITDGSTVSASEGILPDLEVSLSSILNDIDATATINGNTVTVTYNAVKYGEEKITVTLGNHTLAVLEFEVEEMDDGTKIFVDASADASVADGSKDKPFTNLEDAFNAITDVKQTISIKPGDYSISDYTITKDVTITAKDAKITATDLTIDANVYIENVYFEEGNAIKVNEDGALSINNTVFTNSNGAVLSNGALVINNTVFYNCTGGQSTSGNGRIAPGRLGVNLENKYVISVLSGSVTIAQSAFVNCNDGDLIVYAADGVEGNVNNNYWGVDEDIPVSENIAPTTWVIVRADDIEEVGMGQTTPISFNFVDNDENELDFTMPDVEIPVTATIGTLSSDVLSMSKNSDKLNYVSNVEGTETIKVQEAEVAAVFEVVEDETGKIYVATNGSDTTGNGSKANPYATLNQAVTRNTALGGNQEIIVMEGTYSLSSQLTVTRNVTITGRGEVIITQPSNGYFIYAVGSYSAPTSNITLNNLIIENMTASQYGLIYYAGSYSYSTYAYQYSLLTIDNCTFNNNKGPQGVIYGSSYANLKMTNSVFYNNSATSTAGYLIRASGNSFLANYNLFINNTSSSTSTYYPMIYGPTGGNLNYNYWGHNSRPNSSEFTSALTLNNWVILNGTIEDTNLKVNDNYTVNVKFLLNDGSELAQSMPTYAFAVSSNKGITDEDTVTVSDNVGEFVFTPTEAGEGTIYYGPESISVSITKKVTTITVTATDITTTPTGTITATLSYEGTGVEGQTLSLVINGETLTAVTDENGIATFTLNNITEDLYENVEISFAEDATYEGSSATINVNVTKLATSLSAESVSYEYGEGVLNVTLTDELGNAVVGKELTATLKGTVLTATTDENGVASFDLSTMAVDTYNALIESAEDDSYEYSYTTATVTISRITTTLTSEDISVVVGKGTVTITLSDKNGPVAGKTINLKLNDTILEGIVSDENGTAVFDISNIAVGNYLATASITQDDHYKANSITFNVNITKMETSLSTEDEFSLIVGEASINATLTDSEGTPIAGKTISVVINGETLTGVTNENGTATIDLSTITAGNYEDLELIYAGDKINKESSATTKVTISLYSSNLTTEESEVEFNIGEGSVNATLTDSEGTSIAGKTITITVGNTTLTATTDDNGVAVFDLSDIAAGEYETEFVFVADETYTGSTADIKITINKLTTTITTETTEIEDTIGEATIVATLTSNDEPVVGETISVVINGETYSATTNASGIATIDLSTVAAGTYEDLELVFATGDKYTGTTKVINLTINKVGTALVAEESEIEATIGEAEIVVTLTDNSDVALVGKLVSVTINDITYSATTNSEGVAVIDLGAVSAGTYGNLEIIFAGDDTYNKSSTVVDLTINKLNTILDVEVLDGEISILLTDEDNTGIAGETITVVIGNETLTATTDEDGFATISLEDLPAGAYEATISFNPEESSDYASKTITEEIIISTDTIIDVDADDNIVTIVLTDAEGNPIEGEITYTINDGEEITISTDENGTATITVDLGKSAIDIWYDGSDDGVYLPTETEVIVVVNNNTVDVPTSVNATISLESDYENAQVTATIKDLDGNAIANAEVSVTVNGETTTKTTDENGTIVIDAAANATVTVIYTDSIGANASATIIVIENNNTEYVDVPATANGTVELTTTNDSVVITVKDLDGNAIAGASVEVTVDGVTTTLTVGEDGTISIPVEGNATISVTYTDPANNASTISTIVKEIQTEIQNETIYVPVVANGTLDVVSTDDGIEATLTDSEGNPIANATIEAIVNGEATNLTTDENGKVTIPVDGNSTVEVSYTDPENGAVVKYATKVVTNTEYVNQTVEVPVVANGTIDVASTDDGIEATLTDSEGNPIANATIEAIIDGEATNLTTDENGKLTIPVDGNSTVALTYTDPVNNATVKYSTKVITNTVVENQTIIVTPNRTATQIIYSDMNTTAVNTTINGRSGEYFVFYLQDINGNALANKFIQIGFNGKVYNRTTDENGMARLQINLKNKGTYTFAIGFIGDDNYTGSFEVSKIVVSTQKAKLTTANKSYKASAKTKTLTATFKATEGDAKVIAGKKVTFTVNGKTYSATTNANGVATVKVSLNTKGTYSFTAKFAGDNTFAAATASGKLTIK